MHVCRLGEELGRGAFGQVRSLCRVARFDMPLSCQVAAPAVLPASTPIRCCLLVRPVPSEWLKEPSRWRVLVTRSWPWTNAHLHRR